MEREHWTLEDREALVMVTLGAFDLPNRSELVRRITTHYVPRRHFEGAVDVADELEAAATRMEGDAGWTPAIGPRDLRALVARLRGQ